MADDRRLITNLTHYGDTSQLNKILYNESTRSIRDYKKMVRHPMIHLGLSMIKLNLGDITPVWEGEDTEEVLKCKAVFEPIWKGMINDALEMLDYGWKTMEIRYDIGDIKYLNDNKDTKTHAGLILKQPRSLDGETIEILTEETTGGFRGFWQDCDENRTCLAEDGKALLFTNQLSSGNYYGIAETEYVYTYWYDSILERQFYMRWLERKGMGTYIGYHPTGKDDDGTDNSDTMITLLGKILEGTAIAIPSMKDPETGNEQWRIELLEPNDKTDAFIQKAQYNNEMILRGLVIPDQALTQNSTGSYASTDVYMSALIQRKQDILNRVVENINKYMVSKYVEFAFGPNTDVTVKAGKLDDKTKEVALEITKMLIESGTKKAKHEWLNDQSGIPLEDEEELEEVKPEIPLQAEEDVFKNDVQERTEELEQMSEMNDVSRKIDFKQLEFELDTLEAKFIEAMTEELTKQEDRVKKFINKNYDKMFNKPLELARTVEIFTSPINRIFKEYMFQTYDTSYASVKESIEGKIEFAETEKSFISFRVGNAANKFITDLQNAIQYIIAGDLTNNISLNAIFEKISEIFSSFIKTRVPKNASVEGTTVMARATSDYIRDNAKKIASGTLPPEKEIQRMKSVAVMDRRTTDLCKRLNNVVVPVDSPIYKQYQTPRHYMCRSVWVPVTSEDILSTKVKGTNISVDKKGKPYNEKTIISDKLGDAVNQQQF